MYIYIYAHNDYIYIYIWYIDIDVLYGIQYNDIDVYYCMCTNVLRISHALFDVNHLRRFSEVTRMIDKDRVIIVTQPSKVGIHSREPQIEGIG